jgi:hypothetical protein
MSYINIYKYMNKNKHWDLVYNNIVSIKKIYANAPYCNGYERP